MPVSAARPRPETKRTIDVHPCVGALCERNQFLEPVERTCDDIAGLKHQYRRFTANAGKRVAKSIAFDAAKGISLQRLNVGPAQTQKTDRAIDRGMTVLISKDSNLRRTGQASLDDIPATLAQKRAARRCEAGHMRHLTAGDEREAALRRQRQ